MIPVSHDVFCVMLLLDEFPEGLEFTAALGDRSGRFRYEGRQAGAKVFVRLGGDGLRDTYTMTVPLSSYDYKYTDIIMPAQGEETCTSKG